MKERVLLVCTHNSARSQMAEGLLRARYGDAFEVASAGTEPSAVHPAAIEVMSEIGIDISMQTSQHVEEYLGQTFDLVVTVCDHAKEVCPFFPGARRYLHASFPDPSAADDPAEQLDAFRRVRDMIAHWIDTYLATDEIGDTQRFDQMVCYCVGIAESRIVEAVRAGACSLDEIRKQTGACTGGRCIELNPKGRCCSADIVQIIKRETGASSSSDSCCAAD